MSPFIHLALRVGYSGASFQGFQWQPNAPSIQAEIEKALEVLLRKPVRVKFSSRTDRGVHAYDQWVVVPEAFPAFEALSHKQRGLFRYSLNGLLPEGIRVIEVHALKENFSPKKDVLWKEYWYSILQGPVEDPLQTSRVWYIRRDLDISRMRAALQQLEGEHDFRAFSKTPKKKEKPKNSHRRMIRASLQIKRHAWISENRWLIMKFRADGFLHHMVRNLVGTVVEIGLGRSTEVSQILKTRRRSAAGYRAPAHPLILVQTRVRAGKSKRLI